MALCPGKIMYSITDTTACEGKLSGGEKKSKLIISSGLAEKTVATVYRLDEVQMKLGRTNDEILTMIISDLNNPFKSGI